MLHVRKLQKHALAIFDASHDPNACIADFNACRIEKTQVDCLLLLVDSQHSGLDHVTRLEVLAQFASRT